eukprot:2007237-Prymnesium_polylepis.1
MRRDGALTERMWGCGRFHLGGSGCVSRRMPPPAGEHAQHRTHTHMHTHRRPWHSERCLVGSRAGRFVHRGIHKCVWPLPHVPSVSRKIFTVNVCVRRIHSRKLWRCYAGGAGAAA